MKLFKLITALLFLPAFTTAQIIKQNLPKGSKYEVSTTTKLTSVALAMGQEIESTIDNSVVEAIQVKDKRAGETDLTSTINRFVLNLQGMGQQIVYDSDKKDNAPGMATETLDKIKGKTKNFTVDANGKIIKQDKDDEEIAAAAALAGISADALPFLQKSFIGREAKPGTTWYDSTTVVAEKLTTTTKGNYTITAVNAGTITIVFDGTEISSGTIEQMGMEMLTSSSGKVTSQMEVDMATGIIKNSTQTTNGSMNVETGGMNIPVTTKTTITISAKQL
jgi:hypothetical protein